MICRFVLSLSLSTASDTGSGWNSYRQYMHMQMLGVATLQHQHY